ncbi:amidohydrolase family protein [Nannocystis pusilla]|uniref:amidohydrolase family protein n=1 Tax=Nannocystis pusilla TaxID=889268 RepID=UPI003B7F686E
MPTAAPRRSTSPARPCCPASSTVTATSAPSPGAASRSSWPPPLGTVRSIADMRRALRADIKRRKLAGGQWVVGWNYDDSRLREARQPTRADLDEVSTMHPIAVYHSSGAFAVVNTPALRLLGIDADTPTLPAARSVVSRGRASRAACWPTAQSSSSSARCRGRATTSWRRGSSRPSGSTRAAASPPCRTGRSRPTSSRPCAGSPGPTSTRSTSSSIRWSPAWPTPSASSASASAPGSAASSSAASSSCSTAACSRARPGSTCRTPRRRRASLAAGGASRAWPPPRSSRSSSSRSTRAGRCSPMPTATPRPTSTSTPGSG